MLSKRIIACLDVRNGQVVKGVNFEGLRSAGDPAELARRYNAEGIDELVILDITATIEARRALADTIRAVARELFIPLAVGGGIRTEADAGAAVDAGADKVSLNTAALTNPGLITTIAERYGSQAVIVAIDAKKDGDGFAVYARSGSTAAGRDAVEWAREAESRGAGEILLTSIDRDGTKAGFDCALTAAVSSAVSIPVIASGGAGGLDDFVDVFTTGRADAALAASIFHYAETSVRALKLHLQQRGIPVRCDGSTSWLPSDFVKRPLQTTMLIPSIDLKGGAVVQLVQGERLAIKDDDVFRWVRRFAHFPKVQVIDLDAAMGTGDNLALVRQVAGRALLPGRRRHPHGRTRAGRARGRRPADHRRLGALQGRPAGSRSSRKRSATPSAATA